MRYARIRQLLPIILTIFIDLVGVGIIIPVGAPLFLGADGTSLFSAHLRLEYRTLILGALLATAPLLQFFSAPLLGAYADRVGRKRVLLLSILVTGIGHLLFGVGILTRQLGLLFVSRALAGAGAGNLSAANSAMADISDHESKARHFGLVGMAVGLGLILGPFWGGRLSDHAAAAWHTLATPLWFAASLSALNLIFVTFFFRETLRERLDRPMTLLTGARNLAQAFRIPSLRTLYAVNMLFSFGFNLFIQFFSVFVIAKFHFSTNQIGSLIAYVGIWLAFTQGVLTHVVSRTFAPRSVVRWAPLIAAFTLLVLAGVRHEQTIYWLLPVVAMAYGVNPPNVTALISDAAGSESQGEALGLNESMSALSFGVPPLVAAIAATVDVALPLVLAALFILAAWFVFARIYRPAARPIFHEV